jgi:hypothetical protein
MHIPAYARELMDLRHAGLAPDGAVIVTNCWKLAKAAREAEETALVLRMDRDEPDLRGCYGLRVAVMLTQCDKLASSAQIVRPTGINGVPLAAYLSALKMADRGPQHEIDALIELVQPIADACDRARVQAANIYEISIMRRIWEISARQVAARIASEKAKA